MSIEEKALVVKSNALARCKIEVDSIYEQQLIALVASKIHKDDKDFEEYQIPLTDFKEEGEKAAGSTQALIKKGAKNLMRQVVEIKEGKSWALYNVFTTVKYDRAGFITVQFHPDLKPHYLELRHGKFTKYKLTEYMSLPTVYSQRMFEILHSCKSEKEFYFSIDELHEMLQTPSSSRKNYAEFDRYILKPALRHISEHTSLFYAYQPVKKGRRYTKIKFVFTKQKQKDVARKNQKNDAKKNNDLFKESLKCWNEKSNQCDSKSQSQKCKICRMAHQRINL